MPFEVMFQNSFDQNELNNTRVTIYIQTYRITIFTYICNYFFFFCRTIGHFKSQIKSQIISWTRIMTSSLLFSNHGKSIYIKDPFKHSSSSRTLYTYSILYLSISHSSIDIFISNL